MLGGLYFFSFLEKVFSFWNTLITMLHLYYGNVCRGEKKGDWLLQLYFLDFVFLCYQWTLLLCAVAGVAVVWACFYLQVVVPPELGYGDTGAPPDIPPNAVLVFELDLIKIDQRAELWHQHAINSTLSLFTCYASALSATTCPTEFHQKAKLVMVRTHKKSWEGIRSEKCEENKAHQKQGEQI